MIMKLIVLLQKGDVLFKKGNYKEAVICFEKAKIEARNIFGVDDPQYALILNNLAEIYRSMGEYEKAEPLYIQSLDIYEKGPGKNTPEYAASLNNLALLYHNRKEYSKAEPVYYQTLEITKEMLGEKHPDYAQTLSSLASLYRETCLYEKAELLFQQALDLKEEVLGKYHPEYAVSLNSMAILFQQTGKYEKARSLLLQAKDIRKKVLGEAHPGYANSLDNLAKLYREMGEYNQAEQLHLQTLGIIENTQGKENCYYASIIDALALVYVEMGKYNKAESLYKQAMDIREKIFGQKHIEYASSLNNLGGLYQEIKEFGKSHELFQKALDLKEEILGKNHPDYLLALNNLAESFRIQGSYKEAEKLLNKALNSGENTLSKYNQIYAAILNSKGVLYFELKRYHKAVSLLKKAVAITKKTLGENNIRCAISFTNMAEIYRTKGEYRVALDLNNKALGIIEKKLGKEHPNYAMALFNTAMCYISLGTPQKAFLKMLDGAEVLDRMITQMSFFANEKRLRVYIKNFQKYYYALLSIFSEYYTELKKYTPQVFEVILKRKGIVLEIGALRRDWIISSRNPQLKSKFEEIKQARLSLSNLMMERPKRRPSFYVIEGPGKTSNEIYYDIQTLKQKMELEEKIERLDNEIALEISKEEPDQQLFRIDHKTLKNLLPKNTCLVEFVWFVPLDHKKKLYLPPRYMAFVFLPDNIENIQLIDLGEAARIDKLISQYRMEIMSEGGRDFGPLAYKQEKPIKSGSILYKNLFQPILNQIGEIKKMLISPDGDISLLPFEVLPQPNQRYVVEDFEISYVDSGRDLLRFQACDKSQSSALIVADPDFNLAGSDRLYNVSSVKGERSYELEKMVGRLTTGSRFYFNRLKGTKEEGKIIKKLLKNNANTWLGKDALEGMLKQVHGPKILHIATHGYFLPKLKEEELSHLTMDILTEPILLRSKRFENPLLRSGLVLAGVNSFMQGKEPVKDAEDGILTALDVTGLDLIGTDLVVLSACETGLGEVNVGEGIYGLRRAFIIAGARSLIISLWKVPDMETKDLMVRFYTKIMKGKGKATALREAQREKIDKLRSMEKSASPYLWGAFIYLGHPEWMES